MGQRIQQLLSEIINKTLVKSAASSIQIYILKLLVTCQVLEQIPFKHIVL